MSASNSLSLCRAIVVELLSTVLGEEQGQVVIKPVFGNKRPAEFRTLGLVRTR